MRTSKYLIINRTFQSLFCWNLVSNVSAKETELNTITAFQSLFCWNLVSNPVYIRQAGGYFICFNPCFAGIWSRTFERNRIKTKAFKFQSLFCWNLVSNLSCPNCLTAFTICFNPCFAGIWSRTMGGILKRLQMIYVSILVLLEFGLEPKVSDCFSVNGFGFQSLFCWNLVSNRPCQISYPYFALVSILVLLEFGLEPRRWISWLFLSISFNPCFAGIWSRTANLLSMLFS